MIRTIKRVEIQTIEATDYDKLVEKYDALEDDYIIIVMYVHTTSFHVYKIIEE